MLTADPGHVTITLDPDQADRPRLSRIAGPDDGGSRMPVQQWMQGSLLGVPIVGMLLLKA